MTWTLKAKHYAVVLKDKHRVLKAMFEKLEVYYFS